MRQMSFMLTSEPMLARTKTVTRRLGWVKLKRGDLIQAVEQSQGLKKGSAVKKLGVIRIVSVRREEIGAIRTQGQKECDAEGFPNLSPNQFCAMFRRHMNVPETAIVTRIEFEHTNL